MTVKVFAPAKVNLTLHVTGQRDDGYHLIDSLVAFAPVGDCLTISDTPVSSLTVEGPEAAGVPTDMNNLVMKVAQIMAPGRGLAMTLEKNLPVASGIGGGSSDAAAAFRGLSDWVKDEPEFARLQSLDDQAFEAEFRPTLEKILELGADIPMCLLPWSQRVRGIGQKCERVKMPSLPALLVNPRVSVSTADVFKALKQKDNPPMEEALPNFSTVSDMVKWLGEQRNDLAAPAVKICPEIETVLTVLSGLEGCLLARMSGSGATCFAIFDTPEIAHAGAVKLYRDYPNWWRSGGGLGSWIEKSAPIFS